MSDLSQYLGDGGKVFKTVYVGHGIQTANGTGVMVAINPAANQKVVFSVGTSSSEEYNILIGGSVVFTGSVKLLRDHSNSSTAPPTFIGGFGDAIQLTRTATSGSMFYSYMLIEEE